MIEYFKGVRKEISRIRWTNKKDLLKYSVSTILFMLFFGVFFLWYRYVSGFIKE